jgi:hypothetical protein
LAEGFVVLVIRAVVGGAGFVTQRAANLGCEAIVQSVDQLTDVVADIAAVETFTAAIAGEDDFLELLGSGDDFIVAGERAMTEVVDRANLFVGANDAIGQFGELIFESKVAGHD